MKKIKPVRTIYWIFYHLVHFSCFENLKVVITENDLELSKHPLKNVSVFFSIKKL